LPNPPQSLGELLVSVHSVDPVPVDRSPKIRIGPAEERVAGFAVRNRDKLMERQRVAHPTRHHNERKRDRRAADFAPMRF